MAFGVLNAEYHITSYNKDIVRAMLPKEAMVTFRQANYRPLTMEWINQFVLHFNRLYDNSPQLEPHGTYTEHFCEQVRIIMRFPHGGVGIASGYDKNTKRHYVVIYTQPMIYVFDPYKRRAVRLPDFKGTLTNVLF